MTSSTLRRVGNCWIAPMLLLLFLSPSFYSPWSSPEVGNGTSNQHPPGLLVEGATKKRKKADTTKLSKMCSSLGKTPIAANDRRAHAIIEKLLGVTGKLSLTYAGSSQHSAACWMIYDDPKKTKASDSRFIQRYALAVFWFATDGAGHWDEKTDWMSSKDECTWLGVECRRNWLGTKHIVELDLGFNNCHGLLPRELALLTYLEELDLHGNEIQGVIPLAMYASLKNLKTLKLHMNGLFGELQPQVAQLKSLTELSLFGNYFTGPIPKELEKLKHLELLDLYANNFSGTIPKSLGNLKRLSDLDVHDNDLKGTMPKEICASSAMKSLTSDCWGRPQEVSCDCCTVCCQGLPAMVCVDMATKKKIRYVVGAGAAAK